MLDVATAFPVQLASQGSANYLPFGYNRIRIRRALPARVVSHARYRPAKTSTDEYLSFDLAILNEDGDELIRIDGYGMKLVRNAIAPAQELHAFGSGQITANAQSDSQLLSAEGVEVFRRVLSLSGVPQVEISTKGMAFCIHESDAKRNSTIEHDEIAAITNATRYPRPSLSTPYMAARTPLEAEIASIWQDVLGLEQVGIRDDFIELGGHSLLAIQLTSRIRQQFEVELSVATFYNQPTVEGVSSAMIEALVANVDDETLTRALENI
jgi:acyl carrier protein